MVGNLHQITIMSPQKENPQGMAGNKHKYTATSHPMVDEKVL
jgi:hypothetical protein